MFKDVIARPSGYSQEGPGVRHKKREKKKKERRRKKKREREKWTEKKKGDTEMLLDTDRDKNK